MAAFEIEAVTVPLNAKQLVDRLWSYCHVLRPDGVSTIYFTPRALITAMVDGVQPRPDDTIMDPAAGTGGLLLAAFDYIERGYGSALTEEQRRHMRNGGITGVEPVDGTARFAQMNLLLSSCPPR